MIKFSRDILEVRNHRGSNGAKWYIEIDGKNYVVKESFRNKISEHRRHKKFRRPDGATVTGYNNSVYSEYVASNVINFLNFNGVKSHNVSLGIDENDKIYDLCENFLYNGSDLRYNFISIYDISDKNYIRFDGKSIEGIFKFIEIQKYIKPEQLTKYFWSMFMLDALNLNRDRHTDNWGLLYDIPEKRWVPGLVYDNGSCLLAKGDFKEISMVHEKPESYYKDEIIKVWHSLKEKHKDLKRISYVEFLSTTNNKECLEALKEFYEFLDIRQLLSFVDTLDLDDNLKEYYKNIYKSSYELIIKYAYENNPNV